jgi:hypothetical protein
MLRLPSRAMRTPKLIFALLALAAVAGCGGGGGGESSAGSGGSASSSQKNLTADSLGACLNDQNWLAVPSGLKVEGATDGGTTFSLKIYATEAAAKAAGHGKSQDVIGRVVVSYQQPATGTGVYFQPGKKDPAATATIKTCIDNAG